MLYVRIDNGSVAQYPATQEDVRWNNTNVSFPAGNIPDALLAEFNYFPVSPTSATFDGRTQRVEEANPVNINGIWTQAWTIIALTTEEIAQINSDQWTVVREERNAKLAASDWTQLSDAPVDDLAWAVYRQALRDITQQADPFLIVWPIAP